MFRIVKIKDISKEKKEGRGWGKNERGREVGGGEREKRGDRVGAIKAGRKGGKKPMHQECFLLL